MTKFFTADLHLGHKNILKLCNREFYNIKEHDEYVIKMLNLSIGGNDELYILGDFSMSNDINVLRNYYNQIKCNNIHLILGNHDNKQLVRQLQQEGTIKSFHENLVVKENHISLFCSHYPYREWNGYYKNVRHAYGHVHGNVAVQRGIDVGVDAIGYRPLSFEEVINRCDFLEPVNALDRLDTINKSIQEIYPELSVPYIVNMCVRDNDIRRLLYKKLREEKENEE